MIKELILQNWVLMLILTAFSILLKITYFLNKTIKRRLFILIIVVFLLSIVVFAEFYLDDLGVHSDIRIVLTAIRYSATPFIIAMIIFTLAKKRRWFIFLPVIGLTLINVISIFTGIVFSISGDNKLVRGPIGYLPYVAVGIYSILLVYFLFKQSNKQATEIIPIVFLLGTFVSGLVLPLVIGKEYSKIFCSTIAVALFVYYVFLIFQLTKKDSLTGLLNRQSFDALVDGNVRDVTGVVSIDMNGLKEINDKQGHHAGDEALETISLCFMNATKPLQSIYRTGGDEFVIICKRSSENEIRNLIDRIKKNVSSTKYTCAIGYSYSQDSKKTISDMLKESDEMMYKAKDEFYSQPGHVKYRG